MRVAIVVPFHAEPLEQLAQCVESVRNQAYPTELVLVGGGPKIELASAVAKWPRDPHVHVLWMPTPHADFGNCARAVGALHAIGDGVDAVGFLDADNWLDAEHVRKMTELHLQTNAPICTAERYLMRVDGTLMGKCLESNGREFADTSTIFVTRAAFPLLPMWALMPKSLSPIGDRVWWMLAVASKLQRAHLPEPTGYYRTRYAAHYRAIGETPPPEAKEAPDLPPGDYHMEFPAMRLGLKIGTT